jgi:hypothetical protein
MAAQTQQQQPVVSIQLDATDVIGAAGVLASLVAAALFRRLRAMGKQLKAFQRPNLFLPRDLSRINQLLSQLAILTGAQRCVLGVFHNGVLSPEGWHLSRLQCVAAYLAPGTEPISELYRIVPVEHIPELHSLFLSPDGVVKVNAQDPSLSTGCRMYLETRSIACLRNILLKAGAVETGVVSLHHVGKLDRCPADEVFETEQVRMVLKELERLTLLKNKHPTMIINSQYQR